MTRTIQRRRNALTAVALGAWLFALFVGLANACAWDAPNAVSAHAAVAGASKHSAHAGTPAGCAQFCSSDIPVVTKLPTTGDPQDAPPLMVANSDVRPVLAAPPVYRRAQAARSTPDVPPFLRVTRLRL